MVLMVMQHAGFNLRSDSPARLRDLIVNLQRKQREGAGHVRTDAGGADDGRTRREVMLGMVYDIKNNRQRAASHQFADIVERGLKLRKWLHRFSSQAVDSQADRSVATPPRAMVEASGNPLTRGTACATRACGPWLLTGACESGGRTSRRRIEAGGGTLKVPLRWCQDRGVSAAALRVMLRHEQGLATVRTALAGSCTHALPMFTSGDHTRCADMMAAASPELLSLAKRQRMSTPVRRMVFVAMMGADSCADAFQRLIRLNLKVALAIATALRKRCGHHSPVCLFAGAAWFAV